MMPQNTKESVPALSVEEIEKMLRSFRPEPRSRFSRTLMRRYAPEISRFGGLPQALRRNRRVIVIAILALALLLTPLGTSLAQTLARFFRFANETVQLETVSLTPMSSPNPDYPYNEYTLSKAQAETEAGFALKTLPAFVDGPQGWQFHGYNYDALLNSVKQLYTYRTGDDPSIYLFLTTQSSLFEEDWGFCPNGTLHETEVNGLEAEVLDGAVWTTYSEATPGAEREWRCEAMHGQALALRWVEDGLYYEISVTQFETRSDLLLGREDLVELAEGLR